MSGLFGLNPFTISNLVIIAAYFPLSIFIWTRSQSKIARLLSLHTFAVFFWGLGGLFISISLDPEFSLFVWKVACTGVLYIPVFFYHAVHLLTETKRRGFLIFIYVQALISTFLIATGQLINELFILNESFFYHRANLLYFISFLIWTLIAVASYGKLFLYYFKTYPQQKKQIVILLIGILGFSAGATNFLPTFDLPVYPWGNFFIPIHAFSICYAILKYQLLDIKAIYKKSIIYSLLMLFLIFVYTSFVLILNKQLESVYVTQTIVISIMCAFILGVLFFPLKDKIDAIFFQGTQRELILQNTQFREQMLELGKYSSFNTLSSGIVHEIKNPLSTIYTFCHALPKRLDDKAFLLQFSTFMQSEVGRIEELIHQLLDYARPNPLKLQRTDFHQLIDDTLGFLTVSLHKADIEVIRDYTPSNIQVLMDRNQIRQVLLNLFMNAADATTNGGKLTLTTQETATHASLTVRDTGEGMTREEIKQALVPFYTSKAHGTGLGLAISQSIIEKHKGKIRIKSQKGVGTEITFSLPHRA